MTITEAQKYFHSLPEKKRVRFNTLVKLGLQLGKPFEGAHDYAKVVMEKES